MNKLTLLDLFAGIGGFSYAFEYLKLGKTIQFVEKDSYCQQVLTKNFPNTPIHSDIKTFNPSQKYDFITFGSPCQDVSQAGKRKGIHGDRSSLFFDAVRIIKQVHPKGFVMENVTGIRKWQKEIINELQAIGSYNLYWFSLSVKKLGGCHKRERWFCIGWLPTYAQSLYGQERSNPTDNPEDWRHLHSCKQHNWNEIWGESSGCDRMGRFTDVANSNQSRKGRNATEQSQKRSATKITPSSQSAEKEVIPEICRENDGLSRKLDRLINQLISPLEAKIHIKKGTASDNSDLPNRNKRIQALGNAVTPQQAGICFYILLQLIQNSV